MEITNIFFIIFLSLQIGLIYGLIALGFNLLYSSTRIINITYGDFITLSGYITFWLYSLYNISPFLSLGIASFFLILFTLPFYYILEKFVLSSKNILYIETWGVIITFGFSIFLQGIMSYLWSAQSKSYAYLNDVIEFFGISFLLNKFLISIVASLLIFLLYFLLFKTNIGIMLRGVIQDPELASNLGLNMRKIFLIAFIISSVIASIAGVLLSMSFEINPFMGSTYLILAFIIAVIGGIGNPLGSLISGILFGFADVIISYTIGPSLKFFIIYSLLLLVLLYRPWGLLGRGVRYA